MAVEKSENAELIEKALELLFLLLMCGMIIYAVTYYNVGEERRSADAERAQALSMAQIEADREKERNKVELLTKTATRCLQHGEVMIITRRGENTVTYLDGCVQFSKQDGR